MYMNLKPNKHKIIYFNTTTMTSLGFIIVRTPLPPSPPPLLKDLPKIESLGHFFINTSIRRNKSKTGGLRESESDANRKVTHLSKVIRDNRVQLVYQFHQNRLVSPYDEH